MSLEASWNMWLICCFCWAAFSEKVYWKLDLLVWSHWTLSFNAFIWNFHWFCFLSWGTGRKQKTTWNPASTFGLLQAKFSIRHFKNEGLYVLLIWMMFLHFEFSCWFCLEGPQVKVSRLIIIQTTHQIHQCILEKTHRWEQCTPGKKTVQYGYQWWSWTTSKHQIVSQTCWRQKWLSWCTLENWRERNLTKVWRHGSKHWENVARHWANSSHLMVIASGQCRKVRSDSRNSNFVVKQTLFLKA